MLDLLILAVVFIAGIMMPPGIQSSIRHRVLQVFEKLRKAKPTQSTEKTNPANAEETVKREVDSTDDTGTPSNKDTS
jgi:ABC-type transporter MlaC component